MFGDTFHNRYTSVVYTCLALAFANTQRGLEPSATIGHRIAEHPVDHGDEDIADENGGGERDQHDHQVLGETGRGREPGNKDAAIG